MLKRVLVVVLMVAAAAAVRADVGFPKPSCAPPCWVE